MARRALLTPLIGAAGLAASLVIVAATGGSSWRAWLAAAAFAASIPAGAIGWILTMRLAVGTWKSPLAEASAVMAGRMPFAAVLFAPVLLAEGGLYPWMRQAPATGFQRAYFNPLFLDLRNVAWLVGLGLAGWAIGAGRPVSKSFAAVGLIALFLLQTMWALDLLASLDPKFSSSGFGLYVVNLQFLTALALAILAGQPEETHRAGALLLMMMLLWGYFSFMQFFIPWSGNLPAGMAWYYARGHGVWGIALAVVAACRLPVFAALLFRPVRHSRRGMQALAAVVLFGSALEFAWIAIPASGAGPLRVALYALMALAVVALVWPPPAAIPDRGGAA